MAEDKVSYDPDRAPDPRQLDLGFGTLPTPVTDADIATEKQRATAEDALRAVVTELGIEPQLADFISGLAVRAALESFHRQALTNERETQGLLHQCYWDYGAEGCFHLCGILEASRLIEPGDGWEILAHTRPRAEWEPFQAAVKTWVTERTEKRKAMDQSGRLRRGEASEKGQRTELREAR